MLDEGAKAKGYALLCVSEPKSDCHIRVIDEVRFMQNSSYCLISMPFLCADCSRTAQDEIQEQMLCSSENV